MNELIAAVDDLLSRGKVGARLTMVSPQAGGASIVIDGEGGVLAGSYSDLPEAAIGDALQLMERERSETVAYGDLEVYVETLAPPPRLVVFGAVHIGQELAAFAHRLGYHVTVSDARPAFLTQERFPDADLLLPGWPDEVSVDFEDRTFVVVLSHDNRFEEPLWPRLMNSPVTYIGAMGSRRTADRRRQRLLAAGYAPSEVDRIHGPIGLPIGAVTAGEVALAILAEMTMARYRSEESLQLSGTIRLLGRDG